MSLSASGQAVGLSTRQRRVRFPPGTQRARAVEASLPFNFELNWKGSKPSRSFALRPKRLFSPLSTSPDDCPRRRSETRSSPGTLGRTRQRAGRTPLPSNLEFEVEGSLSLSERTSLPAASLTSASGTSLVSKSEQQGSIPCRRAIRSTSAAPCGRSCGSYPHRRGFDPLRCDGLSCSVPW